MTTIISLSNNCSDMPELIKNWSKLPEDVQAVLMDGTHFTADFQELCVYNERKMRLSCAIDSLNGIIIENVFSENGKVWGE